MATDQRRQRRFRRIAGLGLVAGLALLALACQAAPEPTAAPAATAGPEATAAPEPTAAPSTGAIPTVGRYIEKAGLRIFIPEGYVYGGPIIPPDPREPRYGGVAVVWSAGDPPSIDPYHTATSQMILPMGVVYERLVHLPTGPGVDPFVHVQVPGLAESWEISDHFLTYTFHLRKGVKWHNLPPVNGREFDAEDVKATFELMTSKGSAQAGFYDAVERVEVANRYTAVYHMKRVNLGMLPVLATPGRGFILPREMADPASLARRLTAIGTGPFMVEKDYEYKLGLTERRNPDYWVKDEAGNRLPYLDGYRMVIIGDNNAALTAFRTGKIDKGPGLTLILLRGLMKSNPTTLVQETDANPYGIGGVGFRLDKVPWNDVRVRRALAMAIDRETISQTIHEVPFFGSRFVPGAWIGEPDESLAGLAKACGCPWYTYDPQRAKALLAEAGYPNGLTTTYVFHAYGSQAGIEQAELIGSYWKAIGANVAMTHEDLTVFRANLVAGAWSDLGSVFNFPTPGSMDAVVEIFVPGNAANPLTGWVNDDKLTALVQEFQASWRDEARRKDLYRQIRAYWLDQVFTIPSPAGRSYSYFSPRLRNHQPTTDFRVYEYTRVWVPTWIDDEWSFAK